MIRNTKTDTMAKSPETESDAPDCRNCGRFEKGFSGSYCEGYVQCLVDYMARRTDVDLDALDAQGRPAQVADTSVLKHGGRLPDWIRDNVADYSSAVECEQFRYRKPEKVEPVEIAVETWLDAVDVFYERTGLSLGTPPKDENGVSYPCDLPWENCCDQLQSVFQDETFIRALYVLLPVVRFSGAEDRRAIRENIERLQGAAREFICKMALPGRVTEPMPEIKNAKDVSALIERIDVIPGTPEQEVFWKEIIASGVPSVIGPDLWEPSFSLMEALATILTVELPTKDDHRPADMKNVARGLMAQILKRNVNNSKGRPLSDFEIGLLFIALDIDFGTPITSENLARKIRGFQSAALRQARKLPK